ncbi:uncharacterized protein LOC111284270 [Durio zibethinus]|uniref:Uncharacterized protein LOC111284270 n=1 Tax=Durio zibethinus TaxID=66656 RepID=A0A6P5XLD1_DURZI|nr:uncharacterized protein LOC111284270 [Durio zibethinus]
MGRTFAKRSQKEQGHKGYALNSFEISAWNFLKPQKHRLISHALSVSSTSTLPCSNSHDNQILQLSSSTGYRVRNQGLLLRCESSSAEGLPARSSRLEVGSRIIVVEAPKMIKAVASVPCLRVNSGLVKPGDLGRIVSRRPKDVRAVRLAIGTYLSDGKYFKALKFDE